MATKSTHPLPTLFIGSSKEGVDIAHAIQDNLVRDAEGSVWDQGVFGLSDNQLTELTKRVKSADFAIFVCSLDDVSTMRGNAYAVVRDNVIFELGMFIGHIGIDRTFLLVPSDATDIHLPSDLSGLTYGEYPSSRRDGDWLQATGPFSTKVRRLIKDRGFRRKEVHGHLDSLAVAYASCEWIPEEGPYAGIERWERKDELFGRMVELCSAEPVSKQALSTTPLQVFGDPMLDHLATKIRLFAAIEAQPEPNDISIIESIPLDTLPDGNARIRALYSARAISDSAKLAAAECRKLKNWAIKTRTEEHYVRDAQELLYKSFARHLVK